MLSAMIALISYVELNECVQAVRRKTRNNTDTIIHAAGFSIAQAVAIQIHSRQARRRGPTASGPAGWRSLGIGPSPGCHARAAAVA
jgi:hypothetical protein